MRAEDHDEPGDEDQVGDMQTDHIDHRLGARPAFELRADGSALLRGKAKTARYNALLDVADGGTEDSSDTDASSATDDAVEEADNEMDVRPKLHAAKQGDKAAARAQAGEKAWLRAWHDIKEWLKSEGAQVHPQLRGILTDYGGVPVRGVTMTSALHLGDTLIVVPRRLWIYVANFPSFQASPGPTKASSADADLLRLAGALATETQKGDDSFWAPYLRQLPTLSDFHAFHPQLADAPLLTDFGALRVMRLAQAMNGIDARLKRLFEAWREEPGHPDEIDSLTWKDMRQALVRIRSRQIDVEDGTSALVPGVDSMNTLPGGRVNTKWSSRRSGFAVSAARRLNGSEEVFIDYCSECDNSRLLSRWGVYFEGNPVALQRKHAPDCLAISSPITGNEAVLREVTEAALELTEKDLMPIKTTSAETAWPPAPPSVPRCKMDIVDSETQGLLRCYLARLAWEYCADVWHG